LGSKTIIPREFRLIFPSRYSIFEGDGYPYPTYSRRSERIQAKNLPNGSYPIHRRQTG
jgi:hypothetical protein